jgi:very-short-patch-repair endonuclease
VIGKLATHQHGVVSLSQLREAGLSDSAVSRWARRGGLHRLHRGVYAVGHTALDFEGRAWAALMALEPGWRTRPAAGGTPRAAISHRSAAVLWGLLPTRSGPIDVALLTRSGRARRPGIRIRRPRRLATTEVTRRRGIPLTTPARTIFDLEHSLLGPEVRRAVRQAEVLGLRVAAAADSEGTRSELEHLFLRLCRRHGLPEPEVNVRVGGRIVDFLWREQRLVVETDGYRYHRGQAAFEDDCARDLDLRAQGFDVQRLSYRQVTRQPRQVAAILRSALETRRGLPGS